MALHKVLGTETEYGIVVRGDPGFNPAVSSSLVVNSYPGERVKVQWSYEEESPGRDARGFGHDTYGLIDPVGAVVNSVLANGARLYVDHAHPEYSAPESYDPLEAALYDKAGEKVMYAAARQASEVSGRHVSLYKNNSDGKGNSYGAHENYLLSRETPFGEVIRYAMTFMVTRQVFTGAGKVGKENDRPDTDFQVTQRGDFLEEEVGLETTLKRPIINTRDEPHGDPSQYRRFHVILGDANMSEVQNFLKLGTTALMLLALEDGALPDPLDLADPVDACWRVSHDTSLSRPVELDGGSRATAVEIQGRYLEWLTKYAEKELDCPIWDRLLEEWATTLDLLENDPSKLSGTLDWVAKQRFVEGFIERDGLSWSDPKLKALDHQYHDVDPAKGLYHRLEKSGAMRRLFSDDEVDTAVTSPPERTRAYFRGRCVTEFSDSLVAANWDSLVFDVGEAHLKRVPMMEPLKGDADRVGQVIEQAEDAAELLKLLGG